MTRYIALILFSICFIACKKAEDKIYNHGSIVINNSVYEFNKGVKEIINASIIVNEEFVVGKNHIYTLSSENGKNILKLRFITRGENLLSGKYFINSQSVMIRDNSINASYVLEEDYGQTNRINVSNGTLNFQKEGTKENLQFRINSFENEVVVKWIGVVK